MGVPSKAKALLHPPHKKSHEHLTVWVAEFTGRWFSSKKIRQKAQEYFRIPSIFNDIFLKITPTKPCSYGFVMLSRRESKPIWFKMPYFRWNYVKNLGIRKYCHRFCALFQQKYVYFKLRSTENTVAVDGFLLLRRQSGSRLTTVKGWKAAADASFRHIVFYSRRLKDFLSSSVKTKDYHILTSLV